MLAPIQVTCPGPETQTCTFHISLDGKVTTVLRCQCTGGGPRSFYQFLVDDTAPNVGPTLKNGNYLFANQVYSTGGAAFVTRQNYPASVLAGVHNANSGVHTIAVNVGCVDDAGQGGCKLTTHSYTMRVDVFQP